MKKKIGIYISGPKDWYAGIAYLKSVTTCVKKHYQDKLIFYLILDQEYKEAEKSFAGLVDKVIVLDSQKRTLFEKVYGKFIQKDYWIEKILYNAGIDYVFVCNLALDLKHIKMLMWLPDFQHKYYPKYFLPTEIVGRDMLFEKAIRKAYKIIVMSDSVEEDCKKILPLSKRKLVVLRTALDPKSFDVEDGDVLRKYNLPSDFIFVPNQFWQHKNHAFLFKAIKILKEQGQELNFVFTGSTNDYRNPLYFSSLLQMLAELEIREKVFILGMIDRKHVFALYKRCRFLISPSEFEGFGMSALEARACGKCILLSDIPTHRELVGPGFYFFTLSSCEELADKIKELYLLTKAKFNIDYDYETQSKISAESFMKIF